MEATCRKGIPQIIVPGTCDFILYAGVETVPPEILKRKHVIHNPIHTHVRATHDEMVAVGRFIAERLSRSNGPAQILIPSRGFTQLNIAGGPMYDPEADSGFLKGVTVELAKSNTSHIIVEEFDMHINDAGFAEIIVDRIDRMIQKNRET